MSDLHALGRQAVALHRQGRLADAEKLYRQILALDARVFPALYLLGVLRLEQGDSAEAAALLARAVAVNANDPAAWLHYGLAQQGQSDFAGALAAHERALRLQPGLLPARLGRGAALRALGQTGEALPDYEAVLAADPANADAWNGRGALLRKLGRMDEALDSFSKAIALLPQFAEALQNRGELLCDVKKDYAAAHADLQRAMALAPDRPSLADNLLHVEMMRALEACDLDRVQALAAQMPALVAAGRIVPPFMLLLASDDPRLQLENARRLVSARFPSRPPLWRGEAYGHDRIRLAYISSDFNNHAVAGQIAALIERHDRTRFEVLAISTGADDAGPQRRRLKRAFDRFENVRGQDASAIAALIRDLEVDLLVDLNGHTEHDNLDVLRRRAAPAQATWLGFAGTTGAPFIDALIADAVVAPDAGLFSERLYRLPDVFFPTDPDRTIGQAPSRADAGLPADGFVFCSFNRPWKISAPVFACWMQILEAVPGSVLWLKEANPAQRRSLEARAAAAGIDPARLVFAPPLPLAAHLARHQLADLFLDTFPYTGHATACDALWAGLPVLTCKGATYAARVSASLLHTLGLDALTTESLDDYQALAIALARDRGQLAALRARLAKARGTSALFDPVRFARAIETAYMQILNDRLSG
ncbi:MAG TPA: tetratricopeptide repeat protein [Rhizomicrobium sp.]|nr:tetratricopeptide repeat protein [Rhizomicrobium sp.]